MRHLHSQWRLSIGWCLFVFVEWDCPEATTRRAEHRQSAGSEGGGDEGKRIDQSLDVSLWMGDEPFKNYPRGWVIWDEGKTEP